VAVLDTGRRANARLDARSLNMPSEFSRLTTDLNRAGIEVEPTRHIAHQIAHRDHRAGGRGVTRRHGWIGRRNETVAKMQKHEHAVPFGAYGLEQHRPSVRAAMRRRRKRKPDRVARWK